MDENKSKQHETEAENESTQHEPEAGSASETIAHQNETNNQDTFNELDMVSDPFCSFFHTTTHQNGTNCKNTNDKFEMMAVTMASSFLCFFLFLFFCQLFGWPFR